MPKRKAPTDDDLSTITKEKYDKMLPSRRKDLRPCDQCDPVLYYPYRKVQKHIDKVHLKFKWSCPNKKEDGTGCQSGVIYSEAKKLDHLSPLNSNCCKFLTKEQLSFVPPNKRRKLADTPVPLTDRYLRAKTNANFSELSIEINRLQYEKAAIVQQLASQEEDCKHNQTKKVDDLNQIISQLKSECKEKSSLLEKENQHLEKLESEYETAKIKLETERSRLLAVTTLQQEQLNSINIKFREIEDEKTQLELSKQKFQSDLEDANKSVEKLQNENGNLQLQLNLQRKQMQDFNKEERPLLLKQISEIEEKLKVESKQREDLTLAHKNVSFQIAACNESKRIAESELQQIKEDMQEAIILRDKANAIATEHAKQVEEAGNVVLKMNGDLSFVQMELRKAISKIHELTSAQEEGLKLRVWLVQEKGKFEQEIQSLENQLKLQQSANTDLVITNNALTNINLQLQKKQQSQSINHHPMNWDPNVSDGCINSSRIIDRILTAVKPFLSRCTLDKATKNRIVLPELEFGIECRTSYHEKRDIILDGANLGRGSGTGDPVNGIILRGIADKFIQKGHKVIIVLKSYWLKNVNMKHRDMLEKYVSEHVNQIVIDQPNSTAFLNGALRALYEDAFDDVYMVYMAVIRYGILLSNDHYDDILFSNHTALLAYATKSFLHYIRGQTCEFQSDTRRVVSLDDPRFCCNYNDFSENKENFKLLSKEENEELQGQCFNRTISEIREGRIKLLQRLTF